MLIFPSLTWNSLWRILCNVSIIKKYANISPWRSKEDFLERLLKKLGQIPSFLGQRSSWCHNCTDVLFPVLAQRYQHPNFLGNHADLLSGSASSNGGETSTSRSLRAMSWLLNIDDKVEISHFRALISFMGDHPLECGPSSSFHGLPTFFSLL